MHSRFQELLPEFAAHQAKNLVSISPEPPPSGTRVASREKEKARNTRSAPEISIRPESGSVPVAITTSVAAIAAIAAVTTIAPISPAASTATTRAAAAPTTTAAIAATPTAATRTFFHRASLVYCQLAPGKLRAVQLGNRLLGLIR